MMNDAENMAYVLTDFFDSIKKRKEESDQKLKEDADDFEKGRNSCGKDSCFGRAKAENGKTKDECSRGKEQHS